MLTRFNSGRAERKIRHCLINADERTIRLAWISTDRE
jgi:hypothetical protein